MTRPKLTLENEITNYFSHLVDVKPENAMDTLKRIPGAVKKIINTYGALERAKARLLAAEAMDPKDPQNVELRLQLEQEEQSFLQTIYREEIKGT